MDVLIKDGDVVTDTHGNYKIIEGDYEVIQQAVLRITAEKGRFIYDRCLGSACSKLADRFTVQKIPLLEQLINESLCSMNNVYVKVMSASADRNGINALLEFIIGGAVHEKEVFING